MHTSETKSKMHALGKWKRSELSENTGERFKLTPNERCLSKIGTRAHFAGRRKSLSTAFEEPRKKAEASDRRTRKWTFQSPCLSNAEGKSQFRCCVSFLRRFTFYNAHTQVLWLLNVSKEKFATLKQTERFVTKKKLRSFSELRWGLADSWSSFARMMLRPEKSNRQFSKSKARKR